VNLGKFYKRFRRDLAANPKKAALLGIMVLVAAYFWAPLVLGVLPARKGSAAAAAPPDVILADNPLGAAQAAQNSKNAFHWERAQQSIAADATMASATFDRTWRDPFAAFDSPAPPPEEPEPIPSPADIAASAAADAAKAIAPGEAGLVLQGVLVGRLASAATISGEVYREGDVVPAQVAGATVEFQVGYISKQGVALHSNGKRHWLEFSKSKLAPGDEIVRRGKSDK
jgi:hypothetical protein